METKEKRISGQMYNGSIYKRYLDFNRDSVQDLISKGLSNNYTAEQLLVIDGLLRKKYESTKTYWRKKQIAGYFVVKKYTDVFIIKARE